ncbi:MAG TPA: hypothetical protein VLL72_11615, partial [Kiloniellales bacterium]|nr:hypothetical protein [Kiloniellales bacterium]
MADPKSASNPFLRAVPERTRETAPRSPEAPLGAYPRVRLRRNRSAAWTRRLVAESRLSSDDLIWPVFV